MKKNTMMRIASVLLVAVLLSTCTISGTFAKYVTTDSASDAARVAKFGVEVKATGTLFSTGYLKTDNTPATSGTLSVSSSDTNKLVAPGTKNTEGVTFSITGTPEVMVNVAVTFGTEDSDVWLGSGTYTDYTSGDNGAYGIFKLDSAYYPIQYKLYRGDTAADLAANVTAGTTVADGSLKDIQAYFTATSTGMNKDYNPNTNLTTTFGYYKLTWEWVFGDSTNNKADTLLGNLAAGTPTPLGTGTGSGGSVTATNPTKVTNSVTAEADKYDMNVAFNMNITVSQVD